MRDTTGTYCAVGLEEGLRHKTIPNIASATHRDGVAADLGAVFEHDRRSSNLSMRANAEIICRLTRDCAIMSAMMQGLSYASPPRGLDVGARPFAQRGPLRRAVDLTP